MNLTILLSNHQTSSLEELGVFLMIASGVIFFVGLIFVFFNKTRKRGLFMILGAIVMLITGFSICSINLGF